MAAANVVWGTEGPIPVEDLGRTLVHEHVLICPPGAELDPIARIDRREVIARAVDSLAELKDHGVRTFIDPCPIELGRDPDLLAEVASRSGVRIVCATGFYKQGSGWMDGWGIPFYWRLRHPEEIAELFIAELTEGIGETGIRAGVIKCATGSPVGNHERKVLRAAGMAAAAAGVTIITHTDESKHGDEQQDLFASGGAPLERCLIGHQDSQTPEVLAGIIERGSMVGIDRIGWDLLGADSDRRDLIVKLFSMGLGGNVCISQDRMCTFWTPRPEFFVPHSRREYVEQVVLPALDRGGVTRGHAYLFTDFLPMLREAGISEAQIDTLLTVNPRRLLGG